MKALEYLRRLSHLSYAPLTALSLGVFAAALPVPKAYAAPSCLGSGNQCKPDALCTFKAQLAEKVFLYQTYLRNSQVTKKAKNKKRDGIRYNGALYDASVKEAKERFSTATPEELRVKAGQIFQEKIRAYAQANFAIPQCSTGALDRSLLPKEGYSGMFTNEHCQVRVNYLGGDYDPEGFGASHTTSCQEFYDRDRAHEVLHQNTCNKAKDTSKNLDDIDAMIEDEILAYEHSVRLSEAYVRLLSIECSTRPNPDEQKKRAKRIEDLLSPYLKKGS